MTPTTWECHILSLTVHYQGQTKQKPPIAELFHDAQTEIRYNFVNTPGFMTNENQKVHQVSFFHTPTLSERWYLSPVVAGDLGVISGAS